MRLNKHFIAYVLTFAMVLSLGNINEVLAADTLLASANATASSNASSNASANASESASQNASADTASSEARAFIDGLGLKAAASGKTYSGKYRLYIKNIDRKYKIKNVKVSADASGEGVSAVTFTYETTISYKMNKKFVKKVAKTKKAKRTCGNWYYAVVDNNSGLCVEDASSDGVSVSNDSWKYSSYQKVKSGKYSLKVAKKATTNVTILVSDDKINDTSLIVGISTIQKNTDSDKAFWSGSESFDKTSMYSLYKGYAKVLKLSDIK